MSPLDLWHSHAHRPTAGHTSLILRLQHASFLLCVICGSEPVSCLFLLLRDSHGHTLLADLKMIRGVGFVEVILAQPVYNDSMPTSGEMHFKAHEKIYLNTRQHEKCYSYHNSS